MAAPPPADGGSTGFYVYVGNVPKTASEDQLRRFFGECRGIVAFSFRLEDCTYCPTKIAFIKFANRDDQERAYGLNQQFFQGKRVFVASVDSEANFTPKFSVMVKNLNECGWFWLLEVGCVRGLLKGFLYSRYYRGGHLRAL